MEEKYSYIPPLVKKILSNRGYRTEKSMMNFLHSSISSLTEPFSIPHMKEACKTLKNAILKKEKIFIYGDGDTDGICASFLIINLLEKAGANFSFCLTHRLDDEYEIEESLIDELAKDKYSLLISVDCGISSYNALKKAGNLGIKVIVLDHHIGEKAKLPKSHFYINPYLQEKWPEGTEYLSGTGIVYKFVEGMEILMPVSKDERVSNFVELVALSIISDTLPLRGENRIFVKEGIRRMPFTTIKGLAHLIEKQGIKNPVDVNDIAMKVIPVINSPGRLGKPDIALNMLLEKNESHIIEIIKEMEQMDRERYRTVKKAMKILKDKDVESGFIISKDISPGMCGIIASRLTGKYNRPFLVGTISNDAVKGSIRAPENYNLPEHLRDLRKYMLSLGGHREAMGFKCFLKDLPKIKSFWEKIIWMEPEVKHHYDCILDIEELNPSIIEETLSLLEPFGKGNSEPVFLCKDVHFKKVAGKIIEDGTKIWLKKNDTIYEGVLNENRNEIPRTGDILYTPYIRKQNNLYRIILKIRKIYSS